MTYNIVLDIDQMLAFHRVNSIEQGKFIMDKGAILTAIKTHYIYPGTIEFNKLLFSTEAFRVSFFSAGTAERNDEFVRLILERALTEPELKLQSQVRVLSREDLKELECEECRTQHYDLYGIWANDYQKDISKVLSDNDVIENGILIDDQPGNAAFGQVANFLQMPSVDSNDYDALIGKMKFYDAKGMRFLKCIMNFKGSIEVEGTTVEEGSRIFIYKNEEDFEIKFVDLWNVVRVEKVPAANTKLLERLNYLFKLGLTGKYDACVIKDQNVVKNICDFVSSFNGRTRKICRRANRICYVTGLLFTALTYAKIHQTSLSEALFQFQFSLKDDQRTYKSNLGKLIKDDRYYLLGLDKLKEVNENFEFVTPHTYHAYTQLPISDEERAFLQNAKDNEFQFGF